MKETILFVHGIAAIGGAERDLFSLLTRLDRQAWEVMAACPETGPFGDHLKRLGIPVFSVELPPWRKLSSLISRYRAVRAIRSLLGSLRPSIVHVNDMWWVPHVFRAVRGYPDSPVALVAHVRQNIKPEKVLAYSLDQVDSVLAVSQQIGDALRRGGVPPKRVKVLYSGVDISASTRTYEAEMVRNKEAIPSEALVIGTVGNLLPIKGYETVLEALPAILTQVPSAHYLVVGAGCGIYADQLRALVVEKGLDDRVHFAGFQDPVWPYLAAIDLYVQPSVDEAFGLAAVEAMVMGKAVVASRVGGLPEVVVHGRTGLLVPPGDVRRLSDAIISLLQDHQLRAKMGADGLARAREQFDVRSAVRQTENLYRALLTMPQGT